MKKKILFIFAFLGLALGSLLFYKGDPLVSVIVLTYNRQDMLPRALDSVLNQTYKNIEVIVINDASTDETAKVLQKYESKDSRVRVVTNEINRGIVYNRNLGLELSKGEYIAWQDDDDISEPNRIEEQLKYMQSHSNIVILGTDVSLLGTKRMVYMWPTEVDPYEAEIAFLIGRLPVALATAMWKSDFIKKHNIKFNPDIPLSEDFAIYDKVLANGGKIMTLRKTLYQYRVHRSNPDDYYETIGDLQKSFYRERWNRFFPDTKYPETYCLRLKYAKENNRHFKQEVLDKMYAKHCKTATFDPSSYSIIITHQDDEEEPIVVSKNNAKFWSNKLQKNGKIVSYNKEKKVNILWEDEKAEKSYDYK